MTRETVQPLGQPASPTVTDGPRPRAAILQPKTRACDLMSRSGRAESTGCVNSGRRWHRRIPSCKLSDFARPFVFSAVALRALDDIPDEGIAVPRSWHLHSFAVRLVGAGVSLAGCATRHRSPISNTIPAATRTAPSRSKASSPARGGCRSSRSLLQGGRWDRRSDRAVAERKGRRRPGGDAVRVKGRVNDLAMFGGQSVAGLHLAKRTDVSALQAVMR